MSFFKLLFGFALLLLLVTSIFWDNSEVTVSQTLACNKIHALDTYKLSPPEYKLGVGRAAFWDVHKDNCEMVPLSQLAGIKVIHSKTSPGTATDYSLIEINGKRVWVKSIVLNGL